MIETPEALVVHHSASSLTTTVDDVRSWHLDKGWTDVGYHWLIDSDGRLHQGRPWPKVGAHCKSSNYNHLSMGVCLIGDNTKPESRWEIVQVMRLERLIQSIEDLYGTVPVIGHRDVALASTACPGVDVRGLLGL